MFEFLLSNVVALIGMSALVLAGIPIGIFLYGMRKKSQGAEK